VLPVQELLTKLEIFVLIYVKLVRLPHSQLINVKIKLRAQVLEQDYILKV